MAEPQGYSASDRDDINPALKDPLEIKTVSGSSAGAGSGEFHKYRVARRKEMFRLKQMDIEAQEKEEEEAWEKNKADRLQEAEDRKAKNAKKIQKKKEKKLQARQKKRKADDIEQQPGESKEETKAADEENPTKRPKLADQDTPSAASAANGDKPAEN